jgi:elongation factor P--beta-lysine ligase
MCLINSFNFIKAEKSVLKHFKTFVRNFQSHFGMEPIGSEKSTMPSVIYSCQMDSIRESSRYDWDKLLRTLFLFRIYLRKVLSRINEINRKVKYRKVLV